MRNNNSTNNIYLFYSIFHQYALVAYIDNHIFFIRNCTLTFSSRNESAEFYYICIILLLFFFACHIKSGCLAQLWMILIVTNSLLHGFFHFLNFQRFNFSSFSSFPMLFCEGKIDLCNQYLLLYSGLLHICLNSCISYNWFPFNGMLPKILN